MVEANPAQPSPKKAGKKGKGKGSGNKRLRISTAECVVEKPLLREVIEANGYIEIENVQQAADVYFLHPMQEARSKFARYQPIEQYRNVCLDNERVLFSRGIFNRLPGVAAAANKRKQAEIIERMYQLYGEEFDFCPRSYLMP